MFCSTYKPICILVILLILFIISDPFNLIDSYPSPTTPAPPDGLAFSVERGLIRSINQSTDAAGKQRLDCTFEFVIRVHSPASRRSVHYDDVEVVVSKMGATLADDWVADHLVQHPRSATVLKPVPVGFHVDVEDHVARRLINEVSDDRKVKVDVVIRASAPAGRDLEARCKNVVVEFEGSSTARFKKVKCMSRGNE